MTALAYGVVLGPLLFMAQSDPGVDSSPLRALAFAVLAFATIVVGYLLDVTIVTVIGGLIVLTVLTAVLTTTLAGRAALRRSGVDPTARDALGVGRTLHQAITRASGAIPQHQPSYQSRPSYRSSPPVSAATTEDQSPREADVRISSR